MRFGTAKPHRHYHIVSCAILQGLRANLTVLVQKELTASGESRIIVSILTKRDKEVYAVNDFRHVGAEVRSLSNLFRRRLDDGMPPETTSMQGWIIGFLYSNADRDLFQRDIEAEFNIRRSTATGILQLMEKNGLLVREPVDYDARLKKLTLTPKALAMHESVVARIRATEARVRQGLTQEQLDTFFDIMAQFRRNLE